MTHTGARPSFELGGAVAASAAPGPLSPLSAYYSTFSGCVSFLKYTQPRAGFHPAVKQPSKKTTLNVLFTGSPETSADTLPALCQALADGSFCPRWATGGHQKGGSRGLDSAWNKD